MMSHSYNLDNGLHVSIKEMIISSIQLDEEFKIEIILQAIP